MVAFRRPIRLPRLAGDCHPRRLEKVLEKPMQKTWKELEFYYAKRLRESNKEERRRLYGEAYTAVAEQRVTEFKSNDPEQRTAGTTPGLVYAISRYLKSTDRVLEIGAGRGYTSLKLAPLVNSIVATEVSMPSIKEMEQLFRDRQIENASVTECSAYDLVDIFSGQTFTAAISIDVMEHLHPEDAKDHLKQVYDLLEDGGRYVIVMPNRLSGPHDVTLAEYPDSKVPLGFHLNESTYGEMIATMKEIGYRRFLSFFYVKRSGKTPLFIPCPIAWPRFCEFLFRLIDKVVRPGILKRFISIRLVGVK